MEYAHWRCQICGSKDNTLHCHHSYYTRGKEPWQYPDGAIICICQGCHEKIHGKKPELLIPQSEPDSLLVISSKEKFARMRALLSGEFTADQMGDPAFVVPEKFFLK